jgi:hypothetical protein
MRRVLVLVATLAVVLAATAAAVRGDTVVGHGGGTPARPSTSGWWVTIRCSPAG